VVAFNAQGPAGLLDGKAPGHRLLLNPEQREALRRIIAAGPNPAVGGVVRWRLIDLAQWVYAAFRISISKQTLSRMPRAMGYRKLSARSRHHPQDPAAPAAFKKALPRAWRRSGSAMRPADRTVVCRRGAHRAEEQNHPAPSTGSGGPNAARGAGRSAHHLGLSFWRDLPQRGQRRSPRPAALQHRRAAPAFGPRSPGRWRRERTPCCCSIRRDGLCRTNASCPPISPCCRCRPNARN